MARPRRLDRGDPWGRLRAMSSREFAAAALGAVASVLVSGCGNVAAPRAVQCGSQPVQVLPNGSFDAASPAWTQDPPTTALICGASRITPADGTQAACLGGTDGTVESLTQQVPLPDGAKSVMLSGQICVATAETMPVDHDILSFDLLDGTAEVAAIGQVTNQQGAATCQFMPFHLVTTLASDPPTATLRIRSTLDTSMPTSFYVDALTLDVSCQ